MLDVDALAAEIRRVDGSNSLGAGALAEALMPFIIAVINSPDAIENAAMTMCSDDNALWDAKDFTETANGENPEDQREYWRAKARIAADCFIGGENHV